MCVCVEMTLDHNNSGSVFNRYSYQINSLSTHLCVPHMNTHAHRHNRTVRHSPEDISKDFGSFSKTFQRASLWISDVWGNAQEVLKSQPKETSKPMTQVHAHIHAVTQPTRTSHTVIPSQIRFNHDSQIEVFPLESSRVDLVWLPTKFINWAVVVLNDYVP